MTRRFFIAAMASLVLLAEVACRSPHVAITVENRTGAEVRLLEVDYPRGSFGVDALAAGAVYHYRIQVIGEGEVKVQYTDSGNHAVQVTGSKLAEGDQGSIEIMLLPAGKAEFQAQVTRAK